MRSDKERERENEKRGRGRVREAVRRSVGGPHLRSNTVTLQDKSIRLNLSGQSRTVRNRPKEQNTVTEEDTGYLSVHGRGDYLDFFL